MPSVEMGQGIYTAEAVLIAEELDVGLDQVDLVAAPPDTLLYAQPLFKAQMTGGSTSIRGFWTPLRQAGATARAMLVAAAATRWSVPPETCSTDRATVRHEASGRSLSYGELAGDAAAGPTPANVPLKGAGQWKLIGQSVKRLDTPQKVNGQAVFGIDVVVPGMKIAAVRCARSMVAGSLTWTIQDSRQRRDHRCGCFGRHLRPWLALWRTCVVYQGPQAALCLQLPWHQAEARVRFDG